MSATASAGVGDRYLSLCTYRFKQDRSTHILIWSDPFIGVTLSSLVQLILGLGEGPTPLSICLNMQMVLFWVSWHKTRWHLVLVIYETFLRHNTSSAVESLLTSVVKVHTDPFWCACLWAPVAGYGYRGYNIPSLLQLSKISVLLTLPDICVGHLRTLLYPARLSLALSWVVSCLCHLLFWY